MTCAECPATYFGETGHTLGCCIKEHKRSTESQDVANRTAVHHIQTKHRIDWEGATGIEFSIAETSALPSARLITLTDNSYSTLIILLITKASSNSCLI